MNEKIPMEILHLASCLRGIARSGALKDDYRNACVQGADLLKQVRKIVLGSRQSDGQIANRLRELLAKQGEG